LPRAGSVNFSCASRLKVAPCLARATAPPLGMYVAWSQPSTAPAPVKSPISSSRRLSSASLASADGRLRSRFAGSVLAFFAELLVVVLALRLAVVVEGMGGLLLAKKGGTLA
jgi:hypothetical protein